MCRFDSKTFVSRAGTILQGLTFCAKGRRLRLLPKPGSCFTWRVVVEFAGKHREIIFE
jgi:hypothetical protein